MRLSEIKGDRAFDVIADVVEPIANIVGDKNTAKLFKKEKAPDGIDPREFAIDRLKKGVPSLLKSHKSDVIAILAAIEGVTAEEYTSNLDMFKLMRDCTDLMNDPAFQAVFVAGSGDDSSES